MIPDTSLDIPINDLDWKCFGSTASDCPQTSDQIEWHDDNGQIVCSWLSGDFCEGVWVDRTTGLSGSLLADCPNLESVLYQDVISELVFTSGVSYRYTRGGVVGYQTQADEIFVLDCITGNTLSGSNSSGEIL